MSDCLAACANTTSCQTAQYNTINSYCFLKSAKVPLSLSDATETFDRGSGCTNYAPVSGCKVMCNADSMGGNLDWGVYTGNYVACGQLCANNPACATAQYDTSGGYCYQKGSVNANGYSWNDRVISLVCPQQQAAPAAAASTTTYAGASVSPTVPPDWR
jgi:hypothetical protein